MQTIDLTEECRAARERLLGGWLGDTGEAESSVLLDHVSQCPGCLKKWIAIQAAGDLATRAFIAPATDGSRQSHRRLQP